MFQKDLNYLVNKEFKNVFIVDNRNSWVSCLPLFSKETDIVFCLDFALKHELERNGVTVFFLDHLSDSSVLQEINYHMHKFLDQWYKDDLGNDLLVYKGLKLGSALNQLVITEVTSFCHFYFNIMVLRRLNFEALTLAIDNKLVHDIFDKLNFKYNTVQIVNSELKFPAYVFPISFWVKSKLYKESVKQKVTSFLKSAITFAHSVFDVINNKRPNIYIQDYYPTHEIITDLMNSKEFIVRTPDFSLQRSILVQRRIPKKTFKKRIKAAQNLSGKYVSAKKPTWIYDGYDISIFLYEIISPIINSRLNDACNTADSVIQHFKNNRYSLVIPVTNYWLENRLIMNQAKNDGIPVFMIANGILNMTFENDGRDSDYVNCYSEAVKKDYFSNSNHAVCLGDPRMDKYSSLAPKDINRDIPVIIIGAAGFNSIDLNSYLAYEFDFLFDILQVLNTFKREGFNYKIILKVRENGYEHQYNDFIEEYFADLKVNIIRDVAFASLIKQADLYISLYSQTIFEAACHGIPVIYYKKDTQFINKPFNLNSELVTATDINSLQEKIYLFYNGSNIFDAILSKPVLEKYIGPLDGNCRQRNIEFINRLVNEKMGN
jgi:rRNA-processing protein FCF1